MELSQHTQQARKDEQPQQHFKGRSGRYQHCREAVPRGARSSQQSAQERRGFYDEGSQELEGEGAASVWRPVGDVWRWVGPMGRLARNMDWLAHGLARRLETPQGKDAAACQFWESVEFFSIKRNMKAPNETPLTRNHFFSPGFNYLLSMSSELFSFFFFHSLRRAWIVGTCLNAGDFARIPKSSQRFDQVLSLSAWHILSNLNPGFNPSGCFNIFLAMSGKPPLFQNLCLSTWSHCFQFAFKFVLSMLSDLAFFDSCSLWLFTYQEILSVLFYCVYTFSPEALLSVMLLVIVARDRRE